MKQRRGIGPWARIVGSGLLCIAASAGWSQSDAERLAWSGISELGEGFVVWESNREGGVWRIWHRRLDGSDERRVSPDEGGREHVCPAVSPDGAWIAYMSQPKGLGYDDPRAGVHSPLRLVRPDGSGDRQLVPDARRITGGNRAVVWIDEHRLHFLDGENRARRVDIRTGAVSNPLLGERGFIPNAAMTYVFDRHHVHPFDAASGKVHKTGRELGGCEPTFTSDSRWSVRMGGAGGPISRVDPATSKLHDLLRKDDERMPRGRGYVYFPMVSPCRRLLAYAASPGQHDHATSDYDVFVARIDPDTLELTGSPVRYSFDGKTDRYPSPFLTDLPLGRHQGEAPYTVRLNAPKGAVARWQSGDGATGGGATYTHRYSEPGQYAVVATLPEGRELRGIVTVLPSAPPKVVEASVLDARRAWIVFDEPVDTRRTRVTLASGIGTRAEALSDDGRKLTVRFAEDAREQDELTLTGVRDRAERPNEMPPTTVRIERARWPVTRTGLVFAFSSGVASAMLRDADGEFENTSPVLRRLARPDRHGALELARGACEFPDAGSRIVRAVSATGAFSVEAVFRAENRDQGGPARIVTLSRDTGARNFTLGQEKDRLILRLRTPSSGDNGVNPQVDLGPAEPGKTQHVVASYDGAGGLVVRLDGKEAQYRDRYKGALSNWEDMAFLLGDEATADRDWRGCVEAVAVYDRVLTSDEAARSHAAWRSALEARPAAPHWRVETEVVALSPLPTAERAAPYREALVLAEHRVKRAEGEGAPAPGTSVRVAHWALLDGAPVPDAKALRVGKGQWYDVEPFDAQPQARNRYLSDELDVDVDAPVLLDVTPPRR